jgi:hypothetical protein
LQGYRVPIVDYRYGYENVGVDDYCHLAAFFEIHSGTTDSGDCID